MSSAFHSKIEFFFRFRQIQDPASQRLTWYKPPLAVLVIKKVRDQMVLPPFVQLVEWLIQVNRFDFIISQNLFNKHLINCKCDDYVFF